MWTDFMLFILYHFAIALYHSLSVSITIPYFHRPIPRLEYVSASQVYTLWAMHYVNLDGIPDIRSWNRQEGIEFLLELWSTPTSKLWFLNLRTGNGQVNLSELNENYICLHKNIYPICLLTTTPTALRVTLNTRPVLPW